MCYHPMQVKASSPQGSNFQYVPCGHCEQCRDTARFGWSFRLQAEMQYRRDNGWKIGFCTLTYDDDHLPHLWPEMFKDFDKAPSNIPCFSRDHVTRFIHAVRKYLHRHYGVKDISYMVCSEFGEHRHRPHYHLLISWPSAKCLDKCDLGNHDFLDAETMYRIIQDNWIYGFKIPKYFTGGFDGLKNHLPFEVSSPVSFAAKYASKYCCKDIGYYSFLSKYELSTEEYMQDYIKDCMPFHVQSRSLGWKMIAQMSDSEKFDLLMQGYCFDGNTQFQEIPLYIRNKLYFDPSYMITSDGRRLVRRNASKFFEENRREIYQRKCAYYSDLVNRVCRSDFWLSYGLSGDRSLEYAQGVSDKVSQLGWSPLYLGQMYVSYYGVNPSSSYAVDLCDQWFSRYSDYWFYVDEYGELKHDDGISVGNYLVKDDWPLLDEDIWFKVQQFWTFVFKLLEATNNYLKYDKELAALNDYWKCAFADFEYRVLTFA